MKIFLLLFIFLLQFSMLNAQEIDAIILPEHLQLVLDNYEKHWQAQDAEALASLFTADGFILPSGRNPVRGKEAIAEAYKNAGGQLKLKGL